MEITVLCKVVDNFGDIGVCWRLSKQLKVICPENKINLIVDDLSAFKRICPDVEENKKLQQTGGIDVYDWKAFDFCYEEFSGKNNIHLQVILECFQCGRPDWMEKILFDEELNHTVQIIMIDYLSAEKYADDFHKLLSLTRRGKVKKVNFMPGFTSRTGGLVLGSEWKDLEDYDENGNILFFTYERNWTGVAKGISAGLKNESKKICVAQGRGMESAVKAFSEAGGISYEVLDYLSQESWDKMMKKCSFLFIRGEESLSRACLSGIPFVWHAYPQSDEYQLVKVNALLERMKRHFSESDFEIIRRVWLDFNSPESEIKEEEMKLAVENMLKNRQKLLAGFRDFSADLRKNGDLAANLMTFINEIYIM